MLTTRGMGALAAAVALVAATAAPGVASECATCHAPLTAGKKLHAPVKGDGCATCHAPQKGAAGKCKSAQAAAWTLVAAQPGLCQKCHEAQGTTGKLHSPIKSGGCTACHDPHASANPTLMKAWPVEKACYGCHARVDDDKFVHTAVKKGDCKGCHDPHSSEFAPLLVSSKEQLCFECHKADQLAGKHSVLHVPFAEGKCLGCHDPHRSENPAQLVDAGRKLCLTCHDAKAKGPAAASARFRIDLSKPVVHNPLKRDGACQQCHTQKHGGEDRSLLAKGGVAQTCFGCHAQFDFKYQHGAVKVGDCAVCHDPHSSSEKNLLRASGNALCFTCHKDDLTGRRVVHKPIVEKGCTACHDPHGADYRFNLADAEGKALCYKCHKPVDNVKQPHRALSRYGCTACHDPHGSDQGALLTKTTNALCIGCHEGQSTGEHFGAPTHRMSGMIDPKAKQREFGCVSCHSPHGTDNPKGFYFGANRNGMCVYCHGPKTPSSAARTTGASG